MPFALIRGSVSAEVTEVLVVDIYWGRETATINSPQNEYSQVKQPQLCTYSFKIYFMVHWRRQWQPTPVFLPGKSHGQKSLVGCSPWGCEESDTIERLHFHFLLSCIGEGMATHSSVLAWRIPGTAEPGGLPSMGSHRAGHD